MTGYQGVGAAANFDGEVGIQSPAALVGSGNWQVNNSLLYLFGGVLLIIFLIVVLLRTVGTLLRRKLTSRDLILITPGILESLSPQDQNELSQVLTSYHHSPEQSGGN
jgi:hypothetical protein